MPHRMALRAAWRGGGKDGFRLVTRRFPSPPAADPLPARSMTNWRPGSWKKDREPPATQVTSRRIGFPVVSIRPSAVGRISAARSVVRGSPDVTITLRGWGKRGPKHRSTPLCWAPMPRAAVGARELPCRDIHPARCTWRSSRWQSARASMRSLPQGYLILESRVSLGFGGSSRRGRRGSACHAWCP